MNWMRRKVQSRLRGERSRQHRLAGAGHVLDEQVPLAQQGHERQPDLAVLAHDDALDVGGDSLAGLLDHGHWHVVLVCSLRGCAAGAW